MILSLKNISLTIGEHAILHDVSFDVEQGEVIGLILLAAVWWRRDVLFPAERRV